MSSCLSYTLYKQKHHNFGCAYLQANTIGARVHVCVCRR